MNQPVEDQHIAVTRDALARTARNTFVSYSIDRMHDRRADETWISQRLTDPKTRFVINHQGQVLTDRTGNDALQLLTSAQVEEVLRRQPTVADAIFLGQIQETAYFCLDIDGSAGESITQAILGKTNGAFVSLRTAVNWLNREQAALAVQAKALLHWHRMQRYCGLCGSPTHSVQGGYARQCTNATCAHLYFPRIDPAVIVLVTSGERCLLGRQARWPAGRYSNIAGFVEPGESLEGAAIREVYEETGIELGSLTYHSSQPWPFPQSLMIGFMATASTTDIDLQDGELEDARWFTRKAIMNGLYEHTLSLPAPYSISFRLIEDWFDDYSELPRLRALIES